MREIWILVIAMTIVMGIAVVMLWNSDRKQARMQREVRDLEDVLQGLMAANNDPAAHYVVEPVFSGFILSHRTWGVYRKPSIGDKKFRTLIRVFDDVDEEFNHREAVELCEILNGQ